MGLNEQNFRICKATLSEDQNIPTSGTPAAISFDSAPINPNTMWEGVTNPTRITINKPGWYLIVGNIKWTAGTVGDREVFITKNGASAFVARQTGAVAALAQYQTVSAIEFLVAGDYLQLYVNQTSTAALAIDAVAADLTPSLTVSLLMPTYNPTGTYEAQ